MKNKMFDVVHNTRDRLDFAELVCEIITYAIHCDIDEIKGVLPRIPNIVWKLGRNIATLAEFPHLPIIGDLQYPNAINGVFYRIVCKRISKKDSVEKLLTLVAEIGWAIENVSDAQIKQAVIFLQQGKYGEALNAVKPVQ